MKQLTSKNHTVGLLIICFQSKFDLNEKKNITTLEQTGFIDSS